MTSNKMRRCSIAITGLQTCGMFLSCVTCMGINWWCGLGSSSDSWMFLSKNKCCMETKAVEVMILGPPAAPTASLTLPSWSVMMVGTMDDTGRRPGLMKLASDGGMPKVLTRPGVEKSSISLLRTMPVEGEITPIPGTKGCT